jgi:CheY-like chemotaxis protein
MIRKSQPELVLADTVMPAPDGYQLCERLKSGEFGAAVPVVLLADVFEPVDGARLSASGADGQITKPFDARTLQLMVSDQLGIEPPASLPQPAPESLVSPAVRKALQAVSPTTSASMSESDLDAVARKVAKMISEDLVREVVWEVVPEMSEVLIRERLQTQGQGH